MRRLFWFVVLLLCTTALCQRHDSANAKTRFYKADNGVSAKYLELAKDGTYRVIAREHMYVDATEQGHWQQKGSLITFRPSTKRRGGEMVTMENRFYHGVEIEYKGRTFIAFDSDDSAGIVIPAKETEKQLDSEPGSIPEWVFFKVAARVFVEETKKTYPFRYKPDKQ